MAGEVAKNEVAGALRKVLDLLLLEMSTVDVVQTGGLGSEGGKQGAAHQLRDTDGLW